MEAEKPGFFATTKATSWRVVDGSLDDAVTCESSLSALYSDADLIGRRGTLILRRPSPDSGPCEIKICFEQQHEIKQVYVKSTARVYEIYYAASQQDINEYLCTVRCGMAAEKEDSLEVVSQETDCSKTESDSHSGSTKHLDEGELKTDSGSSTNEDGWVEVKDLKCAMLDHENDSLSGKIHASIQREDQDFFEATAEISDGNPCTSISLRLLSVQSGEAVYINEVYVFADPVLFDDEDSTPAPRVMESSSNNHMMSMLVPTLLQLSKSRTSQPFSVVRTSDKTEKDTTPSSIIEQGSISKKLGAPPCQLTQEVSSQPSNKEENLGSHEIKHSLSNIENMLDQLFLRVTKMEEFCSRFEEKMLNPITCMETRLQKVEQHLEELVSKTAALPPGSLGTGATAPDFWNASEAHSSHNDEKCSSYPKEDDIHVEEMPYPLSDKLQTSRECHLVPSLVVTAPEFVCADDEEDNEVTETVQASPKDIPRKHVSINDALASALAGFMSSTSPQDQTIVYTPEVSSTDFSKGSNSNSNSNSSQDVCLSATPDDTAGGLAHLNKTSEADGEDFGDEGKHELGAGSCSGSTESVLELDHVLDERHAENHIDSAVEDHSNNAENGSIDDSTVTVEKIELQNIDECRNESLDMQKSVCIHESGPNDASDIAQKSNASDTTGEQVEGNTVKMPHDVLGLPTPSMIDFKTPILDVQFAKQGDPLFKFSSLEVLLADYPKSGLENLCSQEVDVENLAEVAHPADVMENESGGPEVKGHKLVDLGADEELVTQPR